YRKTAEATLKQNLAVASEVLYTDFKQLGYGASGTSVLLAESQRIRFQADFNNDGVVDTAEYSVSQLIQPNAPRTLYRTINSGTALELSLEVTSFKLEYFDAVGTTTSDPALIKSIVIYIATTRQYSTEGMNPTAHWECRIFPPNL
ncbi:MAG: hypothetical protein ACRDGA_02750, partial [Bacteroidota bacterium]